MQIGNAGTPPSGFARPPTPNSQPPINNHPSPGVPMSPLRFLLSFATALALAGAGAGATPKEIDAAVQKGTRTSSNKSMARSPRNSRRATDRPRRLAGCAVGIRHARGRQVHPRVALAVRDAAFGETRTYHIAALRPRPRPAREPHRLADHSDARGAFARRAEQPRRLDVCVHRRGAAGRRGASAHVADGRGTQGRWECPAARREPRTRPREASSGRQVARGGRAVRGQARRHASPRARG